MAFQFSDDEIQAVKNRFPKLELVQARVWEGELDLFASFDGREMQDLYRISIEVSEKYPDEIPRLKEIGGRTQAIARKYGITELPTLHHNPVNGTACLCVLQEESTRFPSGSSMVKFIDELVVPYLYALSCYEDEPEWPWKEYAHGGLGLLEYEGETRGNHTRETVMAILRSFRTDAKNWSKYREQVIQPKAFRPCPCGSRSQFYLCHKGSWDGMQRLHQSIRGLGMQPKSVVHEAEAATLL